MVKFILALFGLEGGRREDILGLNHVELLVLDHGVEPQLVVEWDDVHVGWGAGCNLLVPLPLALALPLAVVLWMVRVLVLVSVVLIMLRVPLLLTLWLKFTHTLGIWLPVVWICTHMEIIVLFISSFWMWKFVILLFIIIIIFIFCTLLICYVQTVFFLHKVWIVICAFNDWIFVIILFLIIFICTREFFLITFITLQFFTHFTLLFLAFILFFEERWNFDVNNHAIFYRSKSDFIIFRPPTFLN